MTVRVERGDGVLVLTIAGADTLDAARADSVKLAAIEAMDTEHDVVVDLGAVEFMDSSGLGVLVSLYKAARRHGRRAVFAAARPGVLRVMRIIRLDRIFELSDDADEARGLLTGAGTVVR